jgi:hypothetical protein
VTLNFPVFAFRFVLLVGPGGGDELQVYPWSHSRDHYCYDQSSLTPDVRCSQGLKKGIVELCDMVIVNKADGKLADAARSASMDYTSAIKFLQSPSPLWKPKVCMITANKKLMSTICN